jgi:glycosyltransferase involved in cell wall biosynthesis
MFSLVVATLERVRELERLLSSLDVQSYRDLEVIVVDQNADDRLVPVIQRHRGLDILHLRAVPGGSHARNIGLAAARGDLICFPDDDCWYPRDLLALVFNWFEEHPEFVGLFACLRDADGRPVGPKWPSEPCVCTRESLWKSALTPNGFLRRQVTDSIGSFDENIGVGAKSQYQAGEDLDYFLRPLERGYQMWFEPSLTVHHPSYHSIERLRRTTYSYALGGGYVLRTHRYRISFFAWLVCRSLGGAVLSLCKADFETTRMYLVRAAGQLRGYIWGRRDIARLSSRRADPA